MAKIATYFSFQGPTLTFLRPNFGKIEEFSVNLCKIWDFDEKQGFQDILREKLENVIKIYAKNILNLNFLEKGTLLSTFSEMIENDEFLILVAF